MSEAKHKDWILETIDQLRKRKSRPDLERICIMLMRRHGLSLEDIILDLEKLVEENLVLKVVFKGQVSYRIAENTDKLPPILSGEEIKSKIFESFVRMFKGGNHQTELNNSDNSSSISRNKAVSLDSFGCWLTENGGTELQGITSLTCSREKLASVVNKLAEEGKLIEPKPGVYSVDLEEEYLGETQEGKSYMEVTKEIITTKDDNVKPKNSSFTNNKPVGSKYKKSTASAAHAESKDFTTSENVPRADSKTPSPGNKKGRPPTKRKRIKKTHGPDFETYYVPSKYSKRRESYEEKKEKVSSSNKSGGSTTKGERCDFCLLTGACNLNGEHEELLVCKDCQAKGHPSCMEYSEDLARRARSSPWQCIDCKTCCLCDDSGDADAMLFCDACDKGYHMDCHQPPIKEKPTGKWVCTKCLEEDLKKEIDLKCSNRNGSISGESGSTFQPTPRESPVQVSDFKANHLAPSTLTSQPRTVKSILHLMPSFKQFTEKSVPDATDWTIEEVTKYISDTGFKEEAAIFQEQEIDGRSLLLMKRSDVLQGLSLKLGPALKIYAHIQRLQTNGQIIL